MNLVDAKNKVIADLGIGDLPKESQDEIISGLGETVLHQVSASIFNQVPENAHAEFEQISEAGDSKQLAQFLSRYIPNIDQFVRQEMRRTIDEFRSLTQTQA